MREWISDEVHYWNTWVCGEGGGGGCECVSVCGEGGRCVSVWGGGEVDV